VECEVSPQDIDETANPGESPRDLVCRLAEGKARSCLAQQDGDNVVALGSDTVVVYEDRIMGQPRDREDALSMLQALSGVKHRVLTAVTLASRDKVESRLSSTEVCFRVIEKKEIEAYWETGEPLGKAGAYAIQGMAAVFVQSISGSYSGVMGLPLFETAELLTEFGLPCWQPATEVTEIKDE